MRTSLSNVLDCKHCSKHQPLSQIRSPEVCSEKGGSPFVKNLALKHKGLLFCCKCGAQIGSESEELIPEAIGEILLALLRGSLYRVEEAFRGPIQFKLYNRADPDVNCTIAWERPRKRTAAEMAGVKVPDKNSRFDPSTLEARPPVMVEQTIVNLEAKGLRATTVATNVGYGEVLGTVQTDAGPMAVTVCLRWAPASREPALPLR